MHNSKNVITSLRNTYQIKVQLEGIKPPIWRRLQLDSRISLDVLHVVIQCSMGWLEMHLHQFMDREGNFFRIQQGDDDFMVDFGDSAVDESIVLLSDLLKEEKDWIKYEYDFGDGWSHKITLEKILPYKQNQVPVLCTKGKRACPPEDCGGPWGYQHIMDLLAEPNANPEEYQDLIEWLEDEFEPESFDLQEVNEELNELFAHADFNNKSVFETVLHQLESSGQRGLIPELDAMASNPAMPENVQELIEGLGDTMTIINEMSALLDEAYNRFEQIAKISNDKKVTAIAKKMLNRLDK